MDKVMLQKATSPKNLLDEIHRLQIEISCMEKRIVNWKAVRQKLEKSEERYRLLFELAADAILSGDLQGNFIEANHSAINLTGYTNEELIGMKIHHLFSEEELKKKPTGLHAT